MWLIGVPVVTFTIMATVDNWWWAKVYENFNNAASVMGYAFLLFLWQPRHASSFFPFTIRTTQIGIMDDEDMTLGGARDSEAHLKTNAGGRKGLTLDDVIDMQS